MAPRRGSWHALDSGAATSRLACANERSAGCQRASRAPEVRWRTGKAKGWVRWPRQEGLFTWRESNGGAGCTPGGAAICVCACVALEHGLASPCYVKARTMQTPLTWFSLWGSHLILPQRPLCSGNPTPTAEVKGSVWKWRWSRSISWASNQLNLTNSPLIVIPLTFWIAGGQTPQIIVTQAGNWIGRAGLKAFVSSGVQLGIWSHLTPGRCGVQGHRTVQVSHCCKSGDKAASEHLTAGV